jgi:hypothetical protein
MADRKNIARVFKGEGKQPWRFTVIASNGEAVAQSEGYAQRASAIAEAKKIVGDDFVEVMGDE